MDLCTIGIHNWEIVEELDLPHLEERVKANLENRDEIGLITMGYKFYIKKVCLECKKKVDTISPAMKKIRQKYYDKKNRQKLAQKLMVRG